MKSLLLAAAMLLLVAFAHAQAAHAQTGSIRSESLPPLQQQQWQQQGTGPVQQPPSGPAITNQGQQTPGSPPLAGAPPGNGPPATIERPNTWLPATVVKLQALDKVNAQTVALTIKVGATATFGSLTITAKACVVRPADQPADAAAFLAVSDSRPDAPGFNGWMLQVEPAVSMMEHPIYDLRVTGCT
jgi:hypothetical protein